MNRVNQSWQTKLIDSPLRNIIRWVDSDFADKESLTSTQFNWVRALPFVVLHLLALLAFVVEFSWFAFWLCLGLFWLRMFAITAFYHRYFSHRSYKTNRFWQFMFALLGNMAAQRGPLWWAAHHRAHHQYSDTHKDLHSPVQNGFWWSHVGWFTCDASFQTQTHRINDFNKFPELRWLDRYDIFAPLLLITILFSLGAILEAFAPEMNVTGLQLVVWGFFVSTVFLFHSTVTINSLGHIWGRKRFNTKDESRNNWLLGLLTLGEGWHNNHHRYAVSTRQGFYWWEIDITFYLLKLMSYVGIVYDLKPVPKHILAEGRLQDKNNLAKRNK